MLRFSRVWLVAAVAAVGACTLVNAPDDVIPGTGGGVQLLSQASLNFANMIPVE